MLSYMQENYDEKRSMQKARMEEMMRMMHEYDQCEDELTASTEATCKQIMEEGNHHKSNFSSHMEKNCSLIREATPRLSKGQENIKQSGIEVIIKL